jgi:hypothetical protein
MIVNKMKHPVSINLSLAAQKPVAYSYVFNGDDTASKTMVVENLKPEIPTTLKELSITVIAFTNK